MILVDTSVWIDHLNHTERALVALLEYNAVLMHPMILGELDVHFVSPTPVHSPLGVGAQHAAPLQRLAAYL